MASLYQVKASAGSGKTYDLTRRFLCLLAACGAPAPAAAASCGLGTGPSGWDEILAITFTNAAAGEMRDRVIGRLKASPGHAGKRHPPDARHGRPLAGRHPA